MAKVLTELASTLEKYKSLSNPASQQDIREILEILVQLESRHPCSVVNLLIYEVMLKKGNVYEKFLKGE